MVWIILLALMTTGCAAKLTLIRDADGRLLEAQCTRGSSCSYEDETIKVDVNSKFEPLKGALSLGPKIGK